MATHRIFTDMFQEMGASSQLSSLNWSVTSLDECVFSEIFPLQFLPQSLGLAWVTLCCQLGRVLLAPTWNTPPPTPILQPSLPFLTYPPPVILWCHP